MENEPLPLLQQYLEKYPTNWQLESKHVICFKVNSEDPTQLKCIQKFWAEYCSSDDLPRQPCLVTGEVGAITTKLEHKLKYVPDIQGSGASLISAYCASSHSYGHSGAQTSPIGVGTAETLGQALSYLESTPKHRLRIGPILYLFWGASNQLDLNDWFNNPEEEDVRTLLKAINSGNRHPPPVEATDFYVLALSGASGRVIVRDFLQTTVEQVKYSLGLWFEAQSLIDLTGKVKEPAGLYKLAAQAYRDAKKELQAHTLTELGFCALQPGRRLPSTLLHKVLERIRKPQEQSERVKVPPKLQHGCFSLIKLILISWGVKMTVSLDERMEQLNPRQKQAYCCGRLLALFGVIQYYALGQVNSSVIDDSYGAASTTPSRIFGHLEAKAQNHLTDLRKKKPGLAVDFSKQLEEIHYLMPGANFPNILTLEEQGIFAMGYWHQKAYPSVKDQKPNT